KVLEGRFLQPGDSNALVVNDALAERYPELKVGQEATLVIGPSELAWRVVGVVREPFASPTAYISRSYVERVGGHDPIANSIRLALDNNDAATIAAVLAALDPRLDEQGIRAVGNSTKADMRFSFDEHMRMIYVLLVVISCVLAAVGGFGLMTTMSLAVLERR